MKKLFALALGLVMLTGCSEDRLKVIHNNDRVDDLERRMALNEQLDAAQSDLISLNDKRITVLEDQMKAVEADLEALQSQLEDEIAAREAGDDTLDDKIDTLEALIAAQETVNQILQSQINLINSKFPEIDKRLESLQGQINDLSSDIDDLEAKMAGLKSELSYLREDVSNMDSNVDDLAEALARLEDLVRALEDRVEKLEDGQPYRSASVMTVSLSGSPSCKFTGVDGIYAKRAGERVELYNNSACSTSERDYIMIAVIDPTPQSGQFAYYWLTPTKLAVADGSQNSNLKIINIPKG